MASNLNNVTQVTPAEWCGTEEAAQILGIKPSYLYRMTTEGRISYVRIGSTKLRGGTRLYRRSELLQYAETHPLLGTRIRRAS